MSLVVSIEASATEEDGSITTSSFDVVAGNILVAITYSLNATNTISDSGSGTWTIRNQDSGYTKIYTRPVPSNASITVTFSNSTSQTVSLAVFQISGQSTSDPIGAIGNGNSTTNNYTPTIFTSEEDYSVAFIIGIDNNDLGNPSSSDLTDYRVFNASTRSGIKGYKYLGSAGSQTANLDAYGSSAADWYWRALEITAQPAAVTATETATATVAAHVPAEVTATETATATVAARSNARALQGWTELYTRLLWRW